MGNSPVTGEFPAQRPVTQSFGVFFDLRLNKRLSKQSWGWQFETPSRPLWRHCNEMCEISMWNNALLELNFYLVMKIVLFRSEPNYSNLNWKSKTIFQLCVLIECMVRYLPIYTYHTSENRLKQNICPYMIYEENLKPVQIIVSQGLPLKIITHPCTTSLTSRIF